MIVSHVVLDHLPHGLSKQDKTAFWDAHAAFFGPVRQYIDTTLQACYNKFMRCSWGVRGVRAAPLRYFDSE